MYKQLNIWKKVQHGLGFYYMLADLLRQEKGVWYTLQGRQRQPLLICRAERGEGKLRGRIFISLCQMKNEIS